MLRFVYNVNTDHNGYILQTMNPYTGVHCVVRTDPSLISFSFIRHDVIPMYYNGHRLQFVPRFLSQLWSLVLYSIVCWVSGMLIVLVNYYVCQLPCISRKRALVMWGQGSLHHGHSLPTLFLNDAASECAASFLCVIDENGVEVLLGRFSKVFFFFFCRILKTKSCSEV